MSFIVDQSTISSSSTGDLDISVSI